MAMCLLLLKAKEKPGGGEYGSVLGRKFDTFITQDF